MVLVASIPHLQYFCDVVLDGGVDTTTGFSLRKACIGPEN